MPPIYIYTHIHIISAQYILGIIMIIMIINSPNLFPVTPYIQLYILFYFIYFFIWQVLISYLFYTY